MRKDRVPVRLFFLSNTILAPNLLPLSAHSQQDEVSLRAVTDGERDGGGLCRRRSKYVNHSKCREVFLESRWGKAVLLSFSVTSKVFRLITTPEYMSAGTLLCRMSFENVSLSTHTHTHTQWFWFMSITCISEALHFKRIFRLNNDMNNEANVQKIKDSDKWIKNRPFCSLTLTLIFQCIKFSLWPSWEGLCHQSRSICSRESSLDRPKPHLPSTEYFKQDEGVLQSNCGQQLDVDHLI